MALVASDSLLAKESSCSLETLMDQKILCFVKGKLEGTEFYDILKPYLTATTQLSCTGNLDAYFKFVAEGHFICFASIEGYEKQHSIHKDRISIVKIQSPHDLLRFALITNCQIKYSDAQLQFIQFVKHYFEADKII